MSNFLKYMVLKLTDGGLMYESVKKTPVTVKIAEQEGLYAVDENGNKKYNTQYIKKGHNIANPIPYTTLSNMLTVLAGGIPVPTKPKKRALFPSEISRDARFDEMAKNSFYTIDTPVDPDNMFVKQVIGEDGEYYSIVSHSSNSLGGEFINTNKLDRNSNLKCEMMLYVKDDGTPEKVSGYYDFGMLLRLFNDDVKHPGYNRMISFISDELGVEDVRKTHTFTEMAYAFYKKSRENGYAERIGKFYDEMKLLWDDGGAQGRWFYAIFHYGENKVGNNTSANPTGYISKTYLRNLRGADTVKIYVSGLVVVPITDENIYNKILNGKCYCTFLDGGIATIYAFCDGEYDLPNPYFKEDWTKISDEEPAHYAEQQEVA